MGQDSKIFIGSKDVIADTLLGPIDTTKDHLYLIYDLDGQKNTIGDQFVIRGGFSGSDILTDSGNIKIEVGFELGKSADNFTEATGLTPEARNYTDLVLNTGQTVDGVWQGLLSYANALGNGQIDSQGRIITDVPYSAINHNSNATIGVILSAGANINIYNTLPINSTTGEVFNPDNYPGLEDWYITGTADQTIFLFDDNVRNVIDYGTGDTEFVIDLSNFSDRIDPFTPIDIVADNNTGSIDKLVIKGMAPDDLLFSGNGFGGLNVYNTEGQLLVTLEGQLLSGHDNKFNTIEVITPSGQSFTTPISNLIDSRFIRDGVKSAPENWVPEDALNETESRDEPSDFFKINSIDWLHGILDGVDLNSVLSLDGNEWLSDSLITVANGLSYVAMGPVGVLALPAVAGNFIYKLLNQDGVTFNNVIDKVTDVATNFLFDLTTNFSQGIVNTSNNNALLGWQEGTAIDGGNYNAFVDPTVLNVDGFYNAIPSSIVTDFLRSGAGILWDDSYVLDLGRSIDNLYFGSFEPNTLANDYLVGNHIIGAADWSGATYFTGLYDGLGSLLNIDPLVLDIDGDGVELIGFDESVAGFDVDNDGFVENTGWVSSDDALLVHDINGDGIINDITETLSEYYGAAAGTGAIYEDGLAALATLDSNSDGVFDANDTAFNTLRVWQDADEDAQTDAGELKTLTDLSITSIDLAREIVSREELEGNPVLSRSTMVIAGVEQEVAAVDFVTNPLGYEWNDLVEGIKFSTEDGQASSLLIDNENGETVDLALLGVNAAIGNIGDDVIIGDAGDNWIMGGAGSDTLTGGAGNDMLIIDVEDDIANIDAGTGFDVIQVSGTAGVVLNLSDVNAEVAIGGDGGDTLISGSTTNVFMRGGAGNDALIGGSADDALSGEDGDDMVDGGLGDDLLRGHRGQDLLIGDNGDDLLDGGPDDDRLYSGSGEDLLIGGSGNDKLFGGAGYDVAEYKGELNEYNVTTQVDGTVLVEDTVAGRDGIDILTDIEALNFKNVKEVSLNLQAPLTANDIIAINGNGPHTLLASDILANDIDYQGEILHITGLTNVVGGAAVLDGNGDVVFTPDASYQGVMSFKYTIADSAGNAGALAIEDVTGASAEVKGTVFLKQDNHPTDPLFYDQWYLNDINILPVWDDYTGSGVNIGVFEIDIFDASHPDLIDNVNQNTVDNVNNDDISWHPTLVSGIIAASKNGEGSIGVAYDSTISGIGKGEEPSPDVGSYGNYDIVNNSWGWTQPFLDNHNDFPENIGFYQTPSNLGREGLGTVIIFAAGNDRAGGDNANVYNNTNNEYVITVGAINKITDLASLEIYQEPFSTLGANIHVSAPGSHVTSTSLLLENSNGSTFGNTHDDAEGSSFAAPIVSGVVALMLEANPDLGYRDIQEILAYSARIVDDSNTTWQTNGAPNWNGGGLHFSHDYGFGNVDALAAVRLAETWHKQETNHNRGDVSFAGNVTNQTIPDGGTLTDSILVDAPVPLEHVNVTLDFTHPQVGDLIVKITSPDGTESILLDRLGKAPDNPGDLGHGAEDMTFTFGSRAHVGENAEGTWTLEVTDANGGSVGILRSWSLELIGEPVTTFVGTLPPPNTTYIYTDEYLDQTDPGRETLQDSTESTFEDDTLNVAAITGDVTINLTSGTASSLAGKTLNIAVGTTIERLFTGDGNDNLQGNDDNNLIWAGRGDDTVDGGAGDDWILGKSGVNTLTGGAGADNFILQKGDVGEQLIQDFSQGDGDKIRIANYEGVVDISGLTLVQEGTDTRISLPGGEEIILIGILPSSITNADFIFDANFTHQLVRLEKFIGTIGDENFSIGDTFEGHEIYGLEGNDTLFGGWGDDTLYGGDGDDILVGSSSSSNSTGGEDILYGEAGNDTLHGSGQRDILDGGEGADLLLGNSGNDIIHLDGGGDQAIGGAGSETYIAHRLSSGTSGADLIHDFELSFERIDLREFSEIRSFGDLSLEIAQITVGGVPEDAIRIWLTQGAVDQEILLLGFSDTSALVPNNFIFSEDKLPDPKNDSFATNEDTSLAFTNTDLLANDVDTEDGVPSFTKIITGPEHGVLTDDGAGNYIYIPNANYYGSDSFVYEVKDSNEGTATATASIDVNPVNDTPVAGAMGGILNVGTNTLALFFAKFPDAEGDFLSYTATLQDGSALPSWLTFDPQTQKLLGTAPALPEELAIKIIASDGSGQVSHDLTLSVFSLIEGTDLADTIDGTSADDTIYGYLGDDFLYGKGGNDEVLGGDGNDTVRGDDGDDILHGGNDDDDVRGGNDNDTLFGGAGIDRLEGDDGNDELHGGAGNDTLRGELGQDVLYGDDGDDDMRGAEGDDVLYGGMGDDTVTGGYNSSDIFASNDKLYGEGGNDTLRGYLGDDLLDGGSGDDNLYGGLGDDTYIVSSGLDYIKDDGGNDTLVFGAGIDAGDLSFTTNPADTNDLTVVLNPGIDEIEIENQQDTGGVRQIETMLFDDGFTLTFGRYNDWVLGSAAGETIHGSYSLDDTILGYAGDDFLYGKDGADEIHGGDGIDKVRGDNGDDLLHGGNDDDDVRGGNGNDILYGGAGMDRVEGDDGDDILYGGAGNDTLRGELGVDILYGEAGDDDMRGGDGDDVLYGGAGNDTVIGGYNSSDIFASNDVMDGGAGNDSLKGYRGDDTYIVSSGLDYIYDTEGLADVLRFDEISDVNDLSFAFKVGDTTTLVITKNAGVDEIEIDNQLSSNTTFQIETLLFADGSSASLDRYDDWVFGTSVGDTIHGSYTLDDTILGGAGDDFLHGKDGMDELFGGLGNDTLRGDAGDDLIHGGAGDDSLKGYDDNDTLFAGAGTDRMEGHGGADTFVLAGADSMDGNLNRVVDFSTVEGDMIRLEDVLEGYDATTSTLSDFVTLSETGSHTYINVDRDGTGMDYTSQQVVRVENITGQWTDVQDMITQGDLVVV